MTYNRESRDVDSVFGDLNNLQSLTSKMDERSLVLAYGSFAEDALGDLIRAFLIPGPQADRLLDGFNAPLGTFSSRIKAAFALGLITEAQHNDLDRLRKIRNAFAHSWKPTSLSNQAIASHVSAMNFSTLDEDYPANPFEKVRTAIGSLLVEVRSATHQIAKKRMGAKLIGTHLIAGVTGSLEDQIGVCERRLSEIQAEVGNSCGERAKYLIAAHARWIGKFEVVMLNAPETDRSRVKASIAQFKGQWTRLTQILGRPESL